MLCGASVLAAAAPQTPAAAPAPASANPELVGMMSKELGVTPAQAEGGAGALLGLAKTRLTPAEFSEVSSAIPGTTSTARGRATPRRC
jgi:hypothetical protein